MKTKHLLLTLLLALLVPLTATAQSYIYETNGFDDLYFLTDGVPSGWTKFNQYGTGTIASNGEKLVFTSTSLGSLNGQNASMFGVKMDSFGTILRVVKIGFKLKPSAKTSSILFRVGYYLNNTFNEIGTIAANNPLFNSNDLHDPIQEVPFSFVTELPQGARVAFVMATSANNRKWYLDDLYVQDVVPTGLVAGNITHESVELSWDAMTGVDQWQLEYEVNGNGIWNSVVVVNNSYTLTGLEANTPYRARVAVKKSNYISSYSIMSSFTTLNAPVAVGRDNPYECDFDLPVGWNMANFHNWQIADVYNEWIYDGTHLSITNRTSSNANTQNVYINRSCAIYSFKSFTFTNTGTYNFKYYWKSKGESQHDYLRVALVPYSVVINGTASPYDGLSYNTLPDGWIALDGGSELCQTSTPTWTEENHQCTFNSSTLGTYKVVFIWVNDANGTVNNPPASIDDFSISDASAYPPTDVQLTAVSHNSASIIWNHSGFDTQWEVRYKKHSEGVYTEDVIETSIPECHLNDVYGITLESNTEYDVQVRGSNIVSGWTDWSNVMTFTTMCDVVTEFPTSYYFEGDECVKLYGNDISLSSYGAVNCLKYDGGSDQSAAAVLNSTQILTAPNGIWVSFDWRYSSENPDYADGVQLQYANSNYMDDAMWTNAGEFIPRYGTTTGWERVNVFIPEITWGVRYFRLKFIGAGGGACYLDNLTIDRTPDCPAITEISKSFSGSTATLTWAPNGLQNEWQVYYSTNGSTNMSSVPVDDIITVTSPTVTLENLSWGTYVWIRANCVASGTGYGDWTRFDLTDEVDPCASVTGLTHSDTYNHNDITVSWTPAANQTEWQVVYSNNSSFNIDDVTSGQIHVTTEPSYTMQLLYEYTYRVWVRGNCMLDGGYSDWEMISFMPTQYATVTLNEGTVTHAMVPVNTTLTNTENLSMSQFILPQASLSSCVGKIKGLKFYADAAADFTGARFYVYMRETSQTTFSADEFADWNAMIQVYGGPLTIEQEGESYVMNVNLASSYYFDYSGQGNLIVGIKQTVQSTDATAPICAWYGVETTDYASIGMNNSAEITRCQFLPKVQISNRAMDVPCPKPTRLTATNVYHNSIVFSWVAGLEETEWLLSYRETFGGAWTDVTVTENPYTLTGLSTNTNYEITVKANCGGDEYSDVSTTYVTTTMGNQFVTDGDWNVAANWSFNEVPSAGDMVYIAAAAVVPNGCIAEVNTINILSGGSLTIADGGQMKCDNPFYGVVEKDIVGYGAENVNDHSGYYLIATPTLVSVNETFVPKSNSEYLFDQMDFYGFNGNAELEWENPKCSSEEGCEGPGGIILPQGSIFSAQLGMPKNGYLYACQEDGTARFDAYFMNTPFLATNQDVTVNLSYNSSSTAPFNGWNLIGNPFTCNAYLLDENGDVMPFYRMNDAGNAIVGGQPGTAIKPCEGVFVFCPNDGEAHYAVFTTTAPATVGTAQNDLRVALPTHNLIGNQDASVSTVTQTVDLVEGWNWVSFNVVITMDDLKAAIVDALPDQSGMTIKDNNKKTTTYSNAGSNPGWKGSLRAIDLTQMYRISVPAACEISLEGMPMDPAEYPVTIKSGVNWIGFPLAEEMTVATAFAEYSATAGDQIKAKTASGNQIATYNATSGWKGSLRKLTPGNGYIYKSAASGTSTFTFPSLGK